MDSNDKKPKMVAPVGRPNTPNKAQKPKEAKPSVGSPLFPNFLATPAILADKRKKGNMK
jgi:hypothetical protein